MKRRIVITEDQLKEFVKSQINEKKGDFVTGFEDLGGGMGMYTIDKTMPSYSDEAFEKRIRDDDAKRRSRRWQKAENERNGITPGVHPKKKRDKRYGKQLKIEFPDE